MNFGGTLQPPPTCWAAGVGELAGVKPRSWGGALPRGSQRVGWGGVSGDGGSVLGENQQKEDGTEPGDEGPCSPLSPPATLTHTHVHACRTRSCPCVCLPWPRVLLSLQAPPRTQCLQKVLPSDPGPSWACCGPAPWLPHCHRAGGGRWGEPPVSAAPCQGLSRPRQ